MTLIDLQRIVGYAIAKYGGEREVHIEVISDNHPQLNSLPDGRVNEVTISLPELQGEAVLVFLEVP